MMDSLSKANKRKWNIQETFVNSKIILIIFYIKLNVENRIDYHVKARKH